MGEKPEEERSCEYIVPEAIEEKPEEEIKEELAAPVKKRFLKIVLEFIIKKTALLLIVFSIIVISIGYYEYMADYSLKKEIIKFEGLNRKENKAIKEGKLKKAIEDYKKLREDYIRVARKANFIRRRILYNRISKTYKKLEKLKKK